MAARRVSASRAAAERRFSLVRMAAGYERLCRVILEIPGGRCPSGREYAHCDRIRGPGTIAEMLFIPNVRSGHQRMIIASRLVTRSCPYQPAGFRSGAPASVVPAMISNPVSS